MNVCSPIVVKIFQSEVAHWPRVWSVDWLVCRLLWQWTYLYSFSLKNCYKCQRRGHTETCTYCTVGCKIVQSWSHLRRNINETVSLLLSEEPQLSRGRFILSKKKKKRVSSYCTEKSWYHEDSHVVYSLKMITMQKRKKNVCEPSYSAEWGDLIRCILRSLCGRRRDIK